MASELVQIGRITLSVNLSKEHLARVRRAEERINQMIRQKFVHLSLKDEDQAIAIIALELMTLQLREEEKSLQQDIEGRLKSLDIQIQEAIETGMQRSK